MLSSSERKLYVGTLKSRSLTYGVLWPSKSVFMYPWNISTAEAFLMAAPSFLARSLAVADTLEHGLHYPVLLRLWQFVPHSNFKYSLCENVPSYLCSRSLMSIGPSVIAWIPINKRVIHNHQSLAVQHVASHGGWDPGAFPVLSRCTLTKSTASVSWDLGSALQIHIILAYAACLSSPQYFIFKFIRIGHGSVMVHLS